MRKFLKSRWHRVPVALVSALLVLTLVAGGAFAFSGWFTFTTGVADVTVVEAIEVTGFSGDGSVTGNQTDGYTWTVSMYPGEDKTLIVTVHNHSSVGLDLVTDVGTVPAGLTVTGNGGISLEISAPIAGNTTAQFAIIIEADGAAAPGSYTVGFAFQRQ